MSKKSLDDIMEQEGTEKSSPPAPIKSAENGKLTINLDTLRQNNIFFATPCFGGQVTDQFFISMFRVTQELAKMQINFRVTTLRNESLITRARNILTAMFLESTCTHLFFVDADIEFDPESLIRMLAMNKEIIAGAYPKKKLPVEYAINLKFIEGTKKVRVDNGAIEVLDASTGFMLIKREVIEKMIQKYPELFYVNDSALDPKFNKYCYSLFDTMHDPVDNRYLSEDYTFCRRWQKIGGEIWIDPNTKLNHVGSYVFPGDVSKIFKWEK